VREREKRDRGKRVCEREREGRNRREARERDRERAREEREIGGWTAKIAFFCVQGRYTNYIPAETKGFGDFPPKDVLTGT
jgi:hypothetical protein